MNFILRNTGLIKVIANILIFTHLFSFSFIPPNAFAEEGIVPATNKTYKYYAPNGTQVVNIATPNSKGLSHNLYDKFNVDSKGAVLNNTNETLQSKLAGAIRGNPNIKPGQEAGIILNEVVSPNRSFLKGFIEVNGKKADVVVANPWGITANGTGFINTSRAVLSTGVPRVVNGSLQGFSVNTGDISIEGNGIDATVPEYFDLVTRSLKVDGQINARKLNIVTGANNYDYDTRAVTPLNPSTTDAPAYALDSTLFGGMYADKIKIVATESGVGVRMSGDMAANADDVVITSEGTIELRNKTSAKTNIDISYTGDVADGKILLSGQDASLSATGEVNLTSNRAVEFQNGKIFSGGNLNITSETLTDTGSSADFRTSEANINVNTTGKTEINGTAWYASDNLDINSGEFEVGPDGGQFYTGTDDSRTGRSLAIVASTGDIDLSGARVVTAIPQLI
jgi:filamentous hemagglutinin family protein